jgi:hypothetical protein
MANNVHEDVRCTWSLERRSQHFEMALDQTSSLTRSQALPIIVSFIPAVGLTCKCLNVLATEVGVICCRNKASKSHRDIQTAYSRVNYGILGRSSLGWLSWVSKHLGY